MTCDETRSENFPDRNESVGPDRAYVTGALGVLIPDGHNGLDFNNICMYM